MARDIAATLVDVPASTPGRWTVTSCTGQSLTRKLPARLMGLTVPVLDEQTEMFWWDTGHYFQISLRPSWRPGNPWDFAYARALPGYPTYTKDVSGNRPRPRST